MANKNHLSLITVNISIIEQLKEELESFKAIGAIIHFSPDSPLSCELIIKIVKTRMKQNEEQAKKR